MIKIDLDKISKNELTTILIQKDKEIERLNNILDGYEKEMDNLIDARDKAIEYIEERYNGEVLTHTFDKDNVGELLEILKGNDKEWKKEI